MRYFISALLLFQILLANAQSTFAPLNADYYHLVDRYEIMRGKWSKGIFSAYKPYERKSISEMADSLLADSLKLSKVDDFNLHYFLADHSEWNTNEGNKSSKPFLKKLYKNKADLLSFHNEDFDVHFNLTGNGISGQDNSNPFSLNSRGMEVRGMIDKKLGFYSFFTENQLIAPEYVNDRIFRDLSVPQEGFWKRYKNKANGYDFFTARGYITFNPIKHIHIQFGHDKNFIGNGIRSLILSDFSNNYTFLKATTRIWKFQYTNLYANMKGPIRSTSFGTAGSVVQPNKYLAFHHLSINLTRWLNVGLFESVVFANPDSTTRSGYDVSYLNPLIFYRAIEQNNGSPDNALLGLDFKMMPLKNVQLYGQLILDEFLLKEIQAKKGWWGNKYAYQLGVKYINAFTVKNLDFQAEVNRARPFLYQHENGKTNYAHYNTPLAHPLGANFNEMIGVIRYQPINRLSTTIKVISAFYGLDTMPGLRAVRSNFGGNVLTGYRSRRSDFGNEVGQGIKTNLLFIDLTFSYQAMHNVFFDFKYVSRTEKATNNIFSNKNSLISLGIRVNISQRNWDF